MNAKLTVFCCLMCSLAHAGDSASFAFNRAITLPDDGQQSLLALPLDDEVYANSAGDFRDLRISDQQGVDIPYLLQKIASSQVVSKRLPSPSSTQNLEKIDDDGIVITLELDKQAAHADGLTLITSQRDFEYNLQVHGSNDGEHWEKLVNNAAIYDYSRYMAVKNSDIALPGNSYRQFKLVIAQASQTHAAEVLELTRTLRGKQELQRNESVDIKTQPLHIDRIDFWHTVVETLPDELRSVDYAVGAFKVSQDAEHKTSLIDIDTRRQPLTGLMLHADSANFSRHAELQIPRQPGRDSPLLTLASATLDALHYQDINRESTRIDFPEQRQSRYRIVVHNQDNPALGINSITATGPGYQLLFLPQPGASYRLQYGWEKAVLPRYDTAPIQQLLKHGYQTRNASLGPVIAVTAVDAGFDFGALLNSKPFLGAVIALMVMVLAWSLFRVGKRVSDGEAD